MFMNSAFNQLAAAGLASSGTRSVDQARFASDYDRLAPAQKHAFLEAYRATRGATTAARVQETAAREANDHVRLQQNMDAVDPRTHFGRGSYKFPISKVAWEKTISIHGKGRGGLRSAAGNCMPELTLIVPPAPRRLVLPKGFRTCCYRDHFGFCRTLDGDISVAYAAALHHVQTYEDPSSCGIVCLRFRRDGIPDFHVSFIALRRKPRYFAVYAEDEVVNPDTSDVYPYRLQSIIIEQPLIAGVKDVAAMTPDVRERTTGPPVKDGRTLHFMSSFSLATYLARRCPGARMESLTYTVELELRTILVTGAEVLVEDISVPPPKPPARAKARPMRGIDSILAKPLEHQPDNEPRRKRQRGLDRLAGGSTSREKGDGGPWWQDKVPPTCGGNSSGDETDGSGRSAQREYRRNIEGLALADLRRIRARRKAAVKAAPRIRRPPVAPPVEPPPDPGPAVPIRREAPAARHRRKVEWGRYFALAQVGPVDNPTGWSVTCRFHTSEGGRCNKQVGTTLAIDLDNALWRVKHWSELGLHIPDGPGARHSHMFGQGDPKLWPQAALSPIDQLDRAALMA